MRQKLATALCLLVIVCGSAIPATAGSGLVPHPGLGLKAGIAASRWEIPGTSTSNRSGLTGGAWLRLPLGGLAVQGEILWTRKGFGKRSYGGYTDIEVSTDNFEVPVALVLELPAESVHVYLLGGMSFGIVTGAEMRHADSDGWQSADDVLKGTDTLAIFGVGARHDRIALEFRLNYGISNLAEADDVGEIKDRGFAVTVSYSLHD